MVWQQNIMKRKINHNDLIPWFLEDHSQLPEAYVKSCEKFFKEIGHKRQASSSKPQAPSGLSSDTIKIYK